MEIKAKNLSVADSVINWEVINTMVIKCQMNTLYIGGYSEYFLYLKIYNMSQGATRFALKIKGVPRLINLRINRKGALNKLHFSFNHTFFQNFK